MNADHATPPPQLEPIAVGPLAAITLATLVLHAVSVALFAYGYMSDELYYFDCARHLDWGYVDHPPLSIAALAGWRAIAGDSLPMLRLVPTLLACATVALSGAIARELGGGRTAQGFAGLAAATSPLLIGISGFYSMNAFEYALWAGAAWLVARLVRTGDGRLWLWLGVVLGLGLQNKISMSWFGLGLGVGMLLTPERRWLATRWPWLGGAIAAALFAPHVVWQVQHDWPTLEFMRNAAESKMVAKSPLQFVGDQLLINNPLFAPFWIGGLAWYFTPAGRRHRIQAWIWIAVFALLVANSTVRANYLGPAYAPLWAAGGIALERLGRSRRWLAPTTATLFGIGGLAGAPLGIPLLPPDSYVAYSRAIGISPPIEEKTEFGAMPLHYALRFGWPELIDAVDRAAATLSADERARAVVVGAWFGDTGAVNFFGPARGLPPAITGHNSYWLWGPGDATGEVALVIAEDAAPLQKIWRRVERVAEVDCRLCMPNVDRLAVFAVRGLRVPLDEAWAGFKSYR